MGNQMSCPQNSCGRDLRREAMARSRKSATTNPRRRGQTRAPRSPSPTFDVELKAGRRRKVSGGNETSGSSTEQSVGPESSEEEMPTTRGPIAHSVPPPPQTVKPLPSDTGSEADDETETETVKESLPVEVDSDTLLKKLTKLDQGALSLLRIVGWAGQDSLWWGAGYACLCSTTVLSTLQPALFSQLVAAVTMPHGAFTAAVARLAAASVGMTVLGQAQSYSMGEAAFRMNTRLKEQVMDRVMNQDMHFFDETTAAELITQVTSSSSVTSVMTSMIPVAVRGTIQTGTTFVILCNIDTRLALLCLGSVPFELWMSKRYSEIFETQSEKSIEISSKTNQVLQETMQGIQSIRPLHGEEDQKKKYLQNIQTFRALQLETRRTTFWSGTLSQAVPFFNSVMLLYTAGVLAQGGVIGMPDMMTVSMYQQTLQGAMSSLMSLYSEWGRITGMTKKFFKLYDRVPQHRERGDYIPEKSAQKGKLEMRGVYFAYSSGTPVLEDFYLTLNEGESVAFVGPSGGGKSTIVSLLLGLYDPNQGEVFLDGRPITDYDPSWLYTSGVAVVSQSPFMFKGTVKENITIGLPEGSVSDQDVEEAAKKAMAHEFIMEMADGYDTDLGANASKISGGQKQRLAIARAIVRKPLVLLLDEPTSALDNRCESYVKEALNNAMKDRTVVVVAHRLTTIQHLPRIIVMDKGAIAEEGTHEGLLDRGGLYYQLAEGCFKDREAEEEEEG